MALTGGGLVAGPARAAQTGFENWRVAAASLDVGSHHTCVLTAPGGVRCWGDDSYGQLGHDTVTSVGDGTVSIKAAGNIGLGPGVQPVAVTAGHGYTCALLSTGSVRCWGYGNVGQLGHNSTMNISDGVPGHQSIAEAGDVPLGFGVRATPSPPVAPIPVCC